MNLATRFRLWALLLLLLQTVSLLASDLDKEKRWADQILDSIMDGDAAWLAADGHKFLSIFTQADNNSRENALIVMHGIGVHPNWDQVVRPIRVEMTKRGWNTLSIQMPVLANDAAPEDYAKVFPEVSPRIDAAIEYLKSYGSRKIVLIAHSMGSSMSVYYLGRNSDEAIKGLVAIGMNGAAVFSELVKLESVRVPVLDLFGSDDLPLVLENRLNKARAAQSGGNLMFQQREIEGANHFFDDKNDELIDAVSDWLKVLLREK
jgi:pimeloyl-ACP methyl ester carboxylesterase